MWSDFESDVVEGRYPLGKLLRSEGRCGWFETQFKEKPAIISLFESLNDENVLLEPLRAAEKINNRNVATIYEAGATRLQDTPLVYAVMEYTEENLDDVLRARALSAEETKEVAEGLVNALRAIHKERLVCGRLDAASVLASSDTIKLRSDHLQLIAGNVTFEPYAAKDIRDLGSLLHQCLTQKPLQSTTGGNDPSLQLLPPPFVQIVRRTLNGDATVDEIAPLLRPPAAPAPAPAAVPVAAKQTATASKPVLKPQERIAEPPPELAAESLEERSWFSMKTAWIALGVVALLVIVGFAVKIVMIHSNRVQEVADQNPTVMVSPETTTPRKTPPVIPPVAQPKTTAEVAPVTAAPAATGAWRVVAFTYNHRDQAEHKARTINGKHPDLQAGVFSPKGSGAPYLVTLGAATDRASAFRLRDKAVAEGLPRDTYAQNYSR